MNKSIKSLFALVLAIFAITFTSCEKETPEVPNEEEVITTLTYTLTPSGEGESVVLKFQDLDGDGGNAPTITEGTLKANTTYTGAIVLLNETESPAEDITEEIEEEDEEHQFFFASTVSGVSVNYADEDEDGNPIGLKSTLKTGAAGAGGLTITLKHEPTKTAEGVAEGNMTNAGGETDIEVTFAINVQ